MIVKNEQRDIRAQVRIIQTKETLFPVKFKRNRAIAGLKPPIIPSAILKPKRWGTVGTTQALEKPQKCFQLYPIKMQTPEKRTSGN